MGEKVKKPEDMTWADIRAMFAEAAALSKENEIGLKELRGVVAKTEKAVAAATVSAVESSKRTEKELKELKEAVFGVNSEVKGIGKSNGMITEDYFYESLKESKTLGGLHFDLVLRNVGNGMKLENGTTLNDEYDTVMYNDNAVCIVEVKYRVGSQDVRKLAKKRVHNFKKLFPMYAEYKIYLAFGGLTFEKGAVETAGELGIGILKQNGDAVEIYDKDLKVY